MTFQIADTLYYNGLIYTADHNNNIVDAIAISQGVIIASGKKEGLLSFCNENTEQIDLQGRMVMPGIIDAHMHPFWGGATLAGCHLDYQSLSIDDILSRIQKYLDENFIDNDTEWLKVSAWYRESMQPEGVQMTRYHLDTLNTARPILLFSSDCHSVLANSRALELLNITAETPDPPDGNIERDGDRTPIGILEDAPAMQAIDSLPPLTEAQNLQIARHVQKLLNKQGVTTIMDARVGEPQLRAFNTLRKTSELTLRVENAVEITPDDVPSIDDIPNAVRHAATRFSQWHQINENAQPSVAIRHIKLFLDGVLQAPIMTARLHAPYRINVGTDDTPHWQTSDHVGDLYFSPEILTPLITEIARAGYHPHIHTVAEGAISTALDAISEMRKVLPEKDIRPGLAHNELMCEKDYARFTQLKTYPFLSFQWAAVDQNNIEKDIEMLGKSRCDYLETAGKFIDADVTVAFGSDWPIDPLNEWYDFKVAMTRQKDATSPRLDNDRNLTLVEVLRAATINAAEALDMDTQIGSLEVGKFADFIVLDRNLFEISAEDVENVRVLCTIIAGKPTI
ncbi:amidohydrolase [Proteus sp. NMG38-2]|uniref:amidohydrolase n=1 Tax=Proteus sp. NMG38-2 TaxID=2883107 RepID=UPI001D0B5FE4|nr:amidohydrolase [Proteus sp. NMG38-2]UDN37210.1 amidohydrolase [Proteus sp. NMG38-2]